ncbi:nucleolar complex 3 homolog [Pelobates cultripes]|uniref:Nucleolar complex protein 3 homolog n=1 Tax=Pelobates cultripes TaxID=61616 RepID=A0AAD1TFF0_PELCU|nr:nucleolar complex 3 homolog [Pelobates cultripes]
MVGPEDGGGGPGSPACHRAGVTEDEEGEEEADILRLYISGPAAGRMTNGDLGYPSRGGKAGPGAVHTEEPRLPNGGHRLAGPCCPDTPGYPSPSAAGSGASSCSSSPVSAHTVAGYFVSEEADRFRFLDVTLSSRNTFEVSRRQSAPDHLHDGLSLPEGEFGPREQDGDRPWRMGIADFFTRNFFSKKSKEPKAPALSAPGWKLFGKVPPRENVQKDSKIIQQEYEARVGRTCKGSGQTTRRKKFEFEPLSTTALILEDRPANLPAKSVHETLRHRQEYDEMVAEAKKREVKEAQRRKKLMKERFKQEENIASAMVIWNTEILPNWDAVRSTRKVRDLWWQGLPPSVRGKVWSLAIGNELNITPELYEIFLSRAKERWKSFSETGSENEIEDAGVSIADREASLELIKLDISRTFPSLYIFQKLLPAPTLALPFIPMGQISPQERRYSVNHSAKRSTKIFTLYSKSLPLDLACRVWDVFCRDGEEFLFRTALGILRLYEDILLQMDFIHIAQFLTKLPEDITSEKLFSCIAAVQMQNCNKKWTQVRTSAAFGIHITDEGLQRRMTLRKTLNLKSIFLRCSDAGMKEELQRRNRKQAPSFRKLLKTSKIKLDNKLKNKQYKQESFAKKGRKEQKKLREAVRDVTSKIPKPLDQPKKKQPAVEDYELEEDCLPLDMMDEDDIQLMKEMAQRASFLTRDLSFSEPIHATKKKQESVIEKYEKMPRHLKMEAEKEVIHLLPIKDKSGIIPQTMEKPVTHTEEQDDEEMEVEEPAEAVTEEPMPILSTEELLIQRKVKLDQRKTQIATLASSILTDPENNIKKLKELRSMLMEQDSTVAVTVRKLVMLSLMEVFKDITPSYRIRPLTEEEKSSRVKKDTQRIREFEEGLVSQYKFYLENLEQTLKDWKQMKVKKSEVVSVKAYKGLAEVAVKCLCELMVSLSHFNFHNNIVVLVVPLINDKSKQISEICFEAVKKMLRQDKLGHTSLAAVKIISGLVKSHNYDVRPEVLNILLNLRIKEVEVKKDTEDIAPKQKFMSYKEKKKNLSRMQRKWKKAEEKLEKELLEADASENKEKKLKLHTETLNIVFLTYFRILKRAQKSVLLPAVLEGLAKFAHLINIEFFDDLLKVLYTLIDSGDLNYRESLHCVQTAFNILSGQGDVLNIDPLKFYTHLYKTLLKLHAGVNNDDILIALQCLEVMLAKRRKQVSQQRALSFLKRLSTLALHVLPDSCIGILSTNRGIMQTFPKTDILLDNESQGSGLYLPELDEPEYCNAQNTALWELHCLRRHYHPVVRIFAAHLCAGAPSEGSEGLRAELSRKSTVELFADYTINGMTFNPPISDTVCKKKVKARANEVKDDLNGLIQKHLEKVSSVQPDFASYFKPIST